MLRVAAQEDGMRLDLFLARRFPFYSRKAWQGRIERGEVQIEGRPSKASLRLRQGDIIFFKYPSREEPEVNTNYTILYEDGQILAIDKPPNLPVHPSGIYQKNTLYSFLQRQYPNQKIHFVNRIDRETSGLVLIAKDKQVQEKLSRFWHSLHIQKEYLVVVVGNFPPHYQAKGYIGFGVSKIRKKRIFSETTTPPGPLWKWSYTEFFKVAHFNNLSLLKAKLHTGRSHQIRATLCSLGFPVAGDLLYGLDESYYLEFISGNLPPEKRKNLKAERSMLHSFRLFLDAGLISNEPKIFMAPIPGDFLDLFPDSVLEKINPLPSN